MENTIIAAISGPEGVDALVLGEQLANRLDATLVLAHVGDIALTGDVAQAHDEAVAVLDEAKAKLDLRTRVELAPLVDDSPARAVHNLAEQRAASLLVLGSPSQRPDRRTGIGFVGERLLHGASCPVALAPHGYAARPDHGFATIGVAVDRGPEAREAVHFARTLAVSAGGRLRLWSALGAAHADDERRRERAYGLLEQLRADLPTMVPTRVEVLEGDAGAALVQAAEIDGADVIVCGSRDYGPVAAVLMGSVSRYLANHATCPLIVVPRGAAHQPTATAAAGLAAAIDWP